MLLHVREYIYVAMNKMKQAAVVVTLLDFVRRTVRISAGTPATSILAEVFDGLPLSL
jgi:hypothetical protein